MTVPIYTSSCIIIPRNLIDDQGLSSGFLNCIKNALCEMGIEYTHATLDLYLGCIAGCAVVSGGVGSSVLRWLHGGYFWWVGGRNYAQLFGVAMN